MVVKGVADTVCYLLMMSIFYCTSAHCQTFPLKDAISTKHAPDQIFKIAAPLEAKSFPEVEQAILKAYNEMGIQAKIIRMPAKRSLFEASKNTWVDAELGRVAEAEALLKDYIRIPIPLISFEISAYANKEDIDISSWRTMAGYRVATLRGIITITQKLDELDIDYVTTGTVKQVLALVKTGRADVAIIPNGVIENQQAIEFYRLRSQVLKTVQVFHYIHKKHQPIVDDFSQSLSKLLAKLQSQ